MDTRFFLLGRSNGNKCPQSSSQVWSQYVRQKSLFDLGSCRISSYRPVSDRMAGDYVYVRQFLFYSIWILRLRLMVGFKKNNLKFLPIWISRFVLYYAFYSAKRTFVGSDVDSSERVIFSSFYSLLPTSIIDCHYCHQHLNHIIKFIKLGHSI